MTDRNEVANHEKLIEEATAGLNAFDLYWGDGGPVEAAYGRPWELVRRLLAVFEKAHTPTDADEVISERETMAAFVTARLRDNGYEVPESEVRLATPNWDALRAPLRRSQVPEPEMLAPGESSACRDCGCPPGSDAALSGGFWCGHECHGGEPQGEPSDAQVSAAWEAYITAQEADPYDREGRMRAALRAANEVR